MCVEKWKEINLTVFAKSQRYVVREEIPTVDPFYDENQRASLQAVLKSACQKLSFRPVVDPRMPSACWTVKHKSVIDSGFQ